MTVSAITLAGSSKDLSDADVAELRGRLRGPLVISGDAHYEDARRVWNGHVDRRPALVARCTGAADVQQAIGFARTHDLLLSVRGGGHSAPGHGTNDGGLVIGSRHSTPPCATAVRALGSTRMPFIGDRSITRPPSSAP